MKRIVWIFTLIGFLICALTLVGCKEKDGEDGKIYTTITSSAIDDICF